jgi:hypothetical protein
VGPDTIVRETEFSGQLVDDEAPRRNSVTICPRVLSKNFRSKRVLKPSLPAGFCPTVPEKQKIFK